MNSRIFAAILALGLFCLLGLFAAVCLGGCTAVDSEYTGSYDLKSGAYTAGVNIRPAQRAGQGSSSLILKLTGDGKQIVQ